MITNLMEKAKPLMTQTKPLGNNVLIEVIKEDSLVSRVDESESLKRGKVVDISISPYHLTASSYGKIDPDVVAADFYNLIPKVGVIVRWEEFANEGQTFEEDGKTYAIIPWWRLISYEEETK